MCLLHRDTNSDDFGPKILLCCWCDLQVAEAVYTSPNGRHKYSVSQHHSETGRQLQNCLDRPPSCVRLPHRPFLSLYNAPVYISIKGTYQGDVEAVPAVCTSARVFYRSHEVLVQPQGWANKTCFKRARDQSERHHKEAEGIAQWRVLT